MGNRGNIRPRTRVGLKIFGSVLFFLGMINIMFSMKAGLRVQNFYIFLIVAGHDSFFFVFTVYQFYEADGLPYTPPLVNRGLFFFPVFYLYLNNGIYPLPEKCRGIVYVPL